MALATATIWEVRTGGADTNGGGFVAGASGTDWTQQSAAQYSVTDAVTAGTTTITSATAAFGTDVVGNILYITGGTGSITAGWYQIVSRTNSTTIVVDRSTGLTTGTGATLKIGGALLTIGQALTLVVAGNDVYVQGPATFSITSTLTIPAGVDNTDGTHLIGYNVTRGDNPRNTNRPTISVNNQAIVAVTLSNSYSYLGFFILSGGAGGTKGTQGTDQSAEFTLVEGCSATGFSAYGLRISQDGRMTLVDCEATAVVSGGTAGIAAAGNTATIAYCYSHDNPCHGFLNTGASGRFLFCVSDTNTGASSDGFNLGAIGNSLMLNCVAYNNGRDGIRYDSYCLNPIVKNCLLVSNGAYGIKSAAGGASQGKSNGIDYNAFYGNVTAARSGITAGAHDVTLTGDPFTSAAAADFSLNATSGAGLACRGTGYPGTLTGL